MLVFVFVFINFMIKIFFTIEKAKNDKLLIYIF